MSCNFEKHNNNKLVYFTAPNIDGFKCFKHFFSSKLGGVSKGDFESLNLGVFTKDDKENIENNLRLIFDANAMNLNNIVYLNQVHGDIFHFITESNYKTICSKDGDAIITTTPNIPIGIFTADCVPIIIVDKSLKIAAAVHAGWKGTKSEIVKKVIKFIVKELHSNTSDLYAAIGPSIGPCCFEVGFEVAGQFKQIIMKNNKYYVDLWKENEIQMLEAGINENNICVSNLCTMCNDKLFFSYRHDNGKTGRMGTFIQII